MGQSRGPEPNRVDPLHSFSVLERRADVPWDAKLKEKALTEGGRMSKDPVDWDDPSLVEMKSDSRMRRKYRRLQSWYRHEVLRVGPGVDLKGRPIGSLLRANNVVADPTLNFLHRPELAKITTDRIADTSGTVDADRLRRNMLSSQPLCVNLFGPLCRWMGGFTAEALQEVLHLDLAVISPPRIEWNPTPAEQFLRGPNRIRRVLRVHPGRWSAGSSRSTKYTDSFSDDAAIRSSPEKQAKYLKAAAGSR